MLIFASFFVNLAKIWERNFDWHLECAAPKRWLKYTTDSTPPIFFCTRPSPGLLPVLGSLGSGIIIIVNSLRLGPCHKPPKRPGVLQLELRQFLLKSERYSPIDVF